MVRDVVRNGGGVCVCVRAGSNEGAGGMGEALGRGVPVSTFYRHRKGRRRGSGGKGEVARHST